MNTDKQLILSLNSLHRSQNFYLVNGLVAKILPMFVVDGLSKTSVDCLASWRGWEAY